jgi:LmbE family N-acetylglucosaminyl deacetylase
MNVLAIGAHPDDLEMLCGGTLAKYASSGNAVTMVTIANGNLGTVDLDRETIAGIRLGEAQAAAAMIGAQYYCLGIADVEVVLDLEVRWKLTALIRQVRPDLILAHSPDDYMHDHRNASLLAADASFDATIPNIKTDSPYINELLPIMFMDTVAGVDFHPTEYVDITEHFETKRRMLACHESQAAWIAAHDKADLLSVMEVHSRFRGIQAGVRYAEGFRPYQVWGRVRSNRLLP